MKLNEIKKSLYKENPKADLLMIYQGSAHYETALKDGTVIPFSVPVTDMGDARFFPEMEAKLLIRWINKP